MNNEQSRPCSRSQSELAEKTCEYILMHMDKKITIREMAGRMHVSQTQLKNSFRSRYGDSIYRYIRSRKMRLAAEKLREGELSVMEIAGLYGYENCSKFAAAFRGEFGQSPSSYRRSVRTAGKDQNVSRNQTDQ